jgi:DNA primase large subunit
MRWIDCRDQLPPFWVRVLCYVPDTNLFGYDGKPIHIFLYSRMPIYGDRGNNTVPYCWRCENSGNEFGQKVSHWCYLETPDQSHGGIQKWLHTLLCSLFRLARTARTRFILLLTSAPDAEVRYQLHTRHTITSIHTTH